MKVVIDANRVIAALIKESTTREILFDKNIEFYAPEYIKNELEKYRNDIVKRIESTEEEFEILLSLIFEHITIIPKDDYNDKSILVKTETKDVKDIPYFAVCLAINAEGIWTHDPDFSEQVKYKIFSNIDLLRITGRARDSI